MAEPNLQSAVVESRPISSAVKQLQSQLDKLHIAWTPGPFAKALLKPRAPETDFDS